METDLRTDEAPTHAGASNGSTVTISSEITAVASTADPAATSEATPAQEDAGFEETVVGDQTKPAWAILKTMNPSLPTYLLTKSAGDVMAVDVPIAEVEGAQSRNGSPSGTPGGKDSTVQKDPRKGAMGEGYLIGRGMECDIVCRQQHLSKRHCLIFKEAIMNDDGIVEDCIFIEDLSTNGMFVSGEKLINGRRRQLKNNDLIQLAKYDARRHPEKFDDRYWIIQIPQATPSNSTGETIADHYTIKTDALGTGNFATVKVGVHRSTGLHHAIKILNKSRFQGKPKIIQSIRQEVSLLMAVNHPCIINIGGVYDEKDFIYIVLELARGGELFDRIVDKRKFPEGECRVIMKQLFAALKYLHERNIVHRDLKPENILLVSKDPEDLRIKISDFGLAKLVGEEMFLKTLCGTPNYVAPEVLIPANGRAYGKPVDLWSSGVVLYICLCGFPPFSDELAPPSMTDQIKQGKYNFPSPFWDAVSDEAKDLCQRLMTVNPDDRITAEEALEHPWMKMDPDLDKDANLAAIANIPITSFTRGDTVLSPSSRPHKKARIDPVTPSELHRGGTEVVGEGGVSSRTRRAKNRETTPSEPVTPTRKGRASPGTPTKRGR
ncbi:hypothetical protein HDU67_004183 [Dinochytrium kinnereticum]|nr:hypothetical protein HDU67_004183 [Dinochytrium kinnereticum]